MKWRGCFLFLLSFYFITAARGQLITFSVKNERLEKVFLLIEQQSDHHFIYTTEQVEKAKPVTLSVSNEQLSSVLEKCFSGQPLTYNINEKNITVKEKKVVASERPLRGKILDQSGNPVRGVTINIKGTPLVVASDANGEFGFDNAPLNVTLVLTSVEIEPLERFVGDLSFVEIRVSIKVGVLDETIVIAYGKTSRRYTTGSISKVSQSDISRQPLSDPLATLTGRVSGLQVTQTSGIPGSSLVVRLRGQNSIANGNNPLFLIDGVPWPSLSLSGAFGGAGGVNTSPFNVLNPADIESIEVLKDAEATAIYGSRGANGVILITTKKGRAGKAKLALAFYTGAGGVTRKLDLLKTPDYLAMRKEAFRNDGVAPATSTAPDLLLWDTTRYTDWQKTLIGNTMHYTDASLQYSGGNDQTQFFTGAGYHKETTVFPGDFYAQKFSGNLNLNHHSLNKKFSLSVSAGYNYGHSELPMDDLSRFIYLPPNAPAIYGPDGKLNWENSTWTNPFASLNQVFTFRSRSFISTLNTGYRICKGLEAKLNTGFTTLSTNEHAITPRSYYNPAFVPTTFARFGQSELTTMLAEPQLDYAFSMNRIRVNLVAGATFQSSHQQGLYQVGTGYASDDQLGSLRAAPITFLVDEMDIDYRYAGIFGRMTAEYSKRYLVSITARRDGSSRYGPANRFANFGSFGLGWIFSEEPIFKNNSWLSFGKIKASVGTTGNDQIGDYRYLNLYSPSSNAYLGIRPFSPSQLFNPEFGWERVRKWQTGIDLGLWKDRILASVVYYHNTTTNQLVSYPLPTMTGFSGILRNVPATILNSGWEIELNTINIKSSNWKWTSGFNLTIPRNKLVAYEGLASSTYANTYVIGQSLFIAKRYEWGGVDPATGVYMFTDFDRNGLINSPADQQAIVFIGQQFFGGLENSVSYRRFSILVSFHYVQQKHILNYTNFFSRPGVLSNQPSAVMDRWQQPGDVSDVQRFTNSNAGATAAYSNYMQSSGAYTDGSFIRLRNLQLSYDLLSPFMRRWGMSVCKLLVQGQNLVTISRYKGLDPETRLLVPPVRLLTAGIQLTF